MNIKASGRSALVLATGLWLGFAGPTYAAAGADGAAVSEADGQAPSALTKTVRHASHHLKKVAHHKPAKVADKTASADKKPAPAAAADDEDNNSSTAPASDIPPSVANANAQLAASDSPAGSAQAMSDRANTMLQDKPDTPADAQAPAEAPVVSADQLNDVDRALHENTAPAAPLAMASAEAPAAAPSPPVAAAGNENSTWDQTSLIGKIFIGFGALLTMASAARMFMA